MNHSSNDKKKKKDECDNFKYILNYSSAEIDHYKTNNIKLCPSQFSNFKSKIIIEFNASS